MNLTRKPLADVADFCLGKMLDDKKNRGELRRYLANINVRWGEFDLSDLREMRFEHDELDRYGVRYGDIVMCEGGEPGRCAIWKDALPGMMLQKALHRIRPRECLDYRYLFYLFLLMGKTGSFAPLFTGSTIKHLPRQHLAKLEVEFPRLEVQRRVADTLSFYDDLIDNNRRRMALLEESTRLLYLEWFVRLRFPGREHTPVLDGLPNGWERRVIKDVAEINAETLSANFDGDIEYVDISSVSPGVINEVTVYDIRDAPSRARRLVRHGDIIWSCVRPNRRSHSVIWTPPSNLVVSTGFAVISPRSMPTTFLYQAITTDKFVQYLEQNAKGVAYPAVLASDFERAEILVPNRLLIERFDDIARPMLGQLQTLAAQNKKLRLARDLLLPKLLSGELVV